MPVSDLVHTGLGIAGFLRFTSMDNTLPRGGLMCCELLVCCMCACVLLQVRAFQCVTVCDCRLCTLRCMYVMFCTGINPMQRACLVFSVGQLGILFTMP